jgi:hypothetical protein
MNKLLLYTFTLLLISQIAFGQKKIVQEEKFIFFLNSYNKDSLDKILTDSFELIRTYSDFRNDKKTFLNDYLPNSKAYNGKYKIIKNIKITKPRQFLVEDKSDYFKYLKIENPKWLFTVFLEGNKVRKLNIDSTKGYAKFQSEIRKKNLYFDSWIKEKHKEINLETIMKTEGLLLKLLKEYSEENE